MPIPERKSGEKRNDFMDRCISDPKMNEEYPDQKQRVAVCASQADRKKGTK